MYFRLSIITFISLPLLVGGFFIMEINGGNTMVKTENMKAINAVLPPLDKNVPAIIETATFALG